MIWTHIVLSSNFRQSFSNSWIQLLFYFFLYHRLKTLNKEEYNLTHLVLVVILQVFIKNTHGLAYVAFSNISSRLWLGDTTIWHILSIKEIYQVFIQAYNLLLLQRLLKVSILDNTVWPISSFQKKKKKWSNCVWTALYFSNFLPETIRFKSYSSLKYFIKGSTKSSFLYFHQKLYFFLYLHHFEWIEPGTIRVDPYCPF